MAAQADDASPPALGHPGAEGPHEVEGRSQVEAHHPVELLCGVVEHALTHVGGRGEDEHVDLPQLRCRPIHCRRVGDVELGCRRAGSQRCGRLRGGEVPVDTDDLGAVGGEGERALAADAAARPDDDGPLPIEAEQPRVVGALGRCGGARHRDSFVRGSAVRSGAGSRQARSGGRADHRHPGDGQLLDRETRPLPAGPRVLDAAVGHDVRAEAGHVVDDDPALLDPLDGGERRVEAG